MAAGAAPGGRDVTRTILLGLGCVGLAVLVGYALWAVLHVDLAGMTG